MCFITSLVHNFTELLSNECHRVGKNNISIIEINRSTKTSFTVNLTGTNSHKSFGGNGSIFRMGLIRLPSASRSQTFQS